MAEALQWVSRITTVALMMLLPILGGRKLDEMRETKYWGPTGLVLGLLLGAWQLRQIAVDAKRAESRKPTKPRTTDRGTTGQHTSSGQPKSSSGEPSEPVEKPRSNEPADPKDESRSPQSNQP